MQRFVRQVLGCTCPESVLANIRVESASPLLDELPVKWVLDVGGRLLVLICLDPADVEDPEGLTRLTDAALRLREKRCAHRVRIVLPVGEAAGPKLPSPPAPDERFHWHWVPVGDLPHLGCTAMSPHRSHT